MKFSFAISQSDSLQCHLHDVDTEARLLTAVCFQRWVPVLFNVPQIGLGIVPSRVLHEGPDPNPHVPEIFRELLLFLTLVPEQACPRNDP